jgi:hypothetical protein
MGFEITNKTVRFANCSFIYFFGETKWGCFRIGQTSLAQRNLCGCSHREATRARSRAEFISKIQAGLQELEETGYWLELLEESQIVGNSRLASLRTEVNELTAILVSSVKTAKKLKERNASSLTLNGE